MPLATALALVVALVVTAGCGLPPFKRIEKRTSRDLAMVEATVPLPLAVVGDRLRQLFAEGRTPLEAPFQHFLLEDREGGVFPDQSSLEDNATNNPALERYVALAPQVRASDFYLVDVSDTFWTSEYFYNDEPAKFRTDFIIHLAADESGGSSSTRIEVIEYRPVVWVGQRLGLGHSGPGILRDTRVVGPTTEDRQRLLDQLLAALTNAGRG